VRRRRVTIIAAGPNNREQRRSSGLGGAASERPPVIRKSNHLPSTGIYAKCVDEHTFLVPLSSVPPLDGETDLSTGSLTDVRARPGQASKMPAEGLPRREANGSSCHHPA
jgi:hypothetical protein